MAQLTLISPRKRPLQPLVEAALDHEVRFLETAIRRSQEKLRAFEGKHGLSSEEFLRRYENDELEETLELAEWIGEIRLLERLQDKADTLREVQFAH